MKLSERQRGINSENALNAENEQLRRTLRVIYTWATFDDGVALDPTNVEAIINKALHKTKEI